MKKRLVLLLACIFSMMAVAVAQQAVPQVIPALQSWKAMDRTLSPQQ